MKKIYLAALTLAMTACVSNEDLNPVDNYGYIDLNVSNDPIVETRATVTVAELSNWTVIVRKGNDTKYNGTAADLPNQSFTEGNDYTLTVYNCTEVDAQTGFGEARWEGSTQNAFSVNKGATSEVSIDCGSAINSKVGATFNLTNNFTNYKITLDPSTRSLNIDNTETFAYFPAGELSFKFTYDYTDPSGNKKDNQEITSSITCTAGKLHLINIKSDENGTITLKISYDDFTNGDGKTLTFNAATGEKVETSSQGE